MRGFEDSSHAHGEGLPALIAFVEAEAGGLASHFPDAGDVVVSAVGAHRTVRPQARFDVGDGACFGLELRGIENGLSHEKRSYGQKSTSWGLVCQV